MTEYLQTWLLTLHAMWMRRWTGLVAAWIIAVLGGLFVLLHADKYEGSARLFVDTQTVLKPLLVGLAVQPDIDQQVGMVARTLISRPNVGQILDSPGLGFPVGDAAAREKLIDYLSKEVHIFGGGRDNLYTITYRDPQPDRAKRVVERFVNLFVESGAGGKRRDSTDARKFIDDQIQAYEQKLRDSENRLKEFKVRNLGFTGPGTVDYYGRVSALSDELIQMRGQLHAAEQSRDAIRRELAGEQPTMLPESIAGGGGLRGSETDTRLDAAHKQLDELLRRYTEQHPDVIATRRLIAQLEREKREENASITSGAVNRDGIRYSTATNPVFQRLRISLTDAEANVASLQSRVSDIDTRLNQLHADAGRLPKVEAEYAQLNRDYDVLRKNYEALVARRESASMAESADDTSQMADFRVIEPPYVSPKPVFPTRVILIAMVLGASLLGGVGAALALTQMLPTFGSPAELRAASNRPVLGSVSLILSADAAARGRRDSVIFASATVALIGIHVVWAGLLVLQHGI